MKNEQEVARAKEAELAFSVSEGMRAHESMASLLWGRFRRHPGAIASSVLLIVLVLALILVSFSPYDPEESNIARRLEPGWHFLAGNGKYVHDRNGRKGHLYTHPYPVSDRQFLEDLFANQRIVTINIIWLPDGSTETRVVLRAQRRQRLSKKRINALLEIAKKVRNMSLRVEYSY